MEGDSDREIFKYSFIHGINGIKYYIIPKGYPLFRASKTLDENNSMSLKSGRFYFFGLKDSHPSYIEEYHKVYGIIFEFVTEKELALIALDDPNTVDIIYQSAPHKIQNILDKNYGHSTNNYGLRETEMDPDRELSQYLCAQGYQGYAIANMKTIGHGDFHTELMICNAIDNVKLIKQVTTNDVMNQILHNAKLDKLAEEMELKRNESKRNRTNQLDRSPAKKNLFGTDSSPRRTPQRMAYSSMYDSPFSGQKQSPVNNKIIPFPNSSMFDSPLSGQKRSPVNNEIMPPPIPFPSMYDSPPQSGKKTKYISEFYTPPHGGKKMEKKHTKTRKLIKNQKKNNISKKQKQTQKQKQKHKSK
jgi:hypothetical protein